MKRGPVRRPLAALVAAVCLASAALVAGAVVPAVQPPARAGDASAGRAPAAGAAAPGAAKSLVIGVDGVTFAALNRVRAPHIASLRRAGTTARSNLYAEPMAPTLSGPGWSSILSGTWPDKHRVRSNDFAGNRLGRHPDYLSRLDRASPRLRVGAIATWGPIVTDIIGARVDQRTSSGSDDDTTRLAAAALRRASTDSLFVQLDDVDHAGHDHGAASPEYADALRTADQQIGELLSAVRSRPGVARERWLVVVTTDHGHTGSGGHGGNSAQERGTFVIARGAGFAAGAVRHDLRVVDIAPTVLAHHGVARRGAWGLDGRAAREVRRDAFDTLRPRLRGAVDETHDGTSRAWTRSAPRGWRVDNRQMPRGGTTEWRGWSFTTDDFWTGTDRGQGRETNVRSRDVFAVADSDEWDDRPHPAGPFDSTLVTPSYRVTGKKQVALSYVTTYAVDGPQTARVLASVNGRRSVLLKAYTSPTNAGQRLTLRLPRDARNVRFRFRCTGMNSAFWTIDQVRVRAR